MDDIDVVVIGAGAAGIAAARALSGRHSVVVVEARTRVGGRAWTYRYGSIGLDLGATWLHSADENEWGALAPSLGFAVDPLPPPWDRPAHRANFSADERAEYHAAWDRFYARIDEAAAQGSTRLMSDFFEPGGRWNGLLGAMVTYINGAEADELVLAEYARYRDTEVNRRIPRGYGALIAAYARPLDIRLSCPATLIEHAGARVRVTTPHGTLTARAVIVAVPPGLMANETLRFSPPLPEKLEAANALPLGVADKMFLRIEGGDDLPAETRLYGAIDRVETGSYTLRPFGRPVIDGYFGGAFARELESQGDGAFAAFAIEQICAALGNDMRKRLTPIAESAWARDPWSLGAYSYGSKGAQAARAKLAAAVSGKLFFAGEHCSDVDFSTAHGAYRTGVKAAEDAIKALERRVPAD
ncbi:MAG TPA: NAD(P)/FAD-dependent oxidoreductase [Xanthobacteraceae bacterium]|nr:NAD(P)/FAD-dependent oxidoreductase [Xanthobacteraceae bacterium]